MGLAQVKKVAAEIRLDKVKAKSDSGTVQAVITHRYEVLAKYAKSLSATCAEEIKSLKARSLSVDCTIVRTHASQRTRSPYPPLTNPRIHPRR